MFDPNADPLSDPALADLVAKKLLKAADHPWELEQPPDWDPLEATERFLRLSGDVNRILGAECEIELWPMIKQATFHGEIILPAAALQREAYAVIRLSNFGNLVAVLNDDSAVKPEVLVQLRRRFERSHYKYIPSTLLRRAYDGHHRGTRQFGVWADRLFGYL
jgi:hypothetical protein